MRNTFCVVVLVVKIDDFKSKFRQQTNRTEEIKIIPSDKTLMLLLQIKAEIVRKTEENSSGFLLNFKVSLPISQARY